MTSPAHAAPERVGHALRPRPAGSGVRTEEDSLGAMEVPSGAYYGIHTCRALDNFSVTGIQLSAHPDLVCGIASIKAAAARANLELRLLGAVKARAITDAAEEIVGGALHDQFVVDVLQGGAGTSANMNCNEVIANRGLELLGHPLGSYRYLDPIDDVNQSQSTNDVYPTAIKVALQLGIGRLETAMRELEDALSKKAYEFDDVLKVGRTQLQDAVPMTLGQEFRAFAVTLGEDRERLSEARNLILEINLGGTAIGTGLNAHPQYARLVRGYLAQATGLALVTAPDLIEATSDTGAFVQLSSVFKRIAVKLSKMCNDLRLLSSGPRAGLNEINLPAVQAGSSIMPGKVNPVIPELINQIAFEVIGFDVTITMAAEAGQLQLNAFEPIIAHSLLSGVAHLTAGCHTLAARCISGITANREHVRRLVESSVGLVTALTPIIGYQAAALLAHEALATRRSIYELVRESSLVPLEQLDSLIGHLDQLTRPRTPAGDPLGEA